jgi:hypothetical protein
MQRHFPFRSTSHAPSWLRWPYPYFSGLAQDGLQLGGWDVDNFLGWVKAHTIDVVRAFWADAVVFRMAGLSLHLSAVAKTYFFVDSVAFIAANAALHGACRTACASDDYTKALGTTWKQQQEAAKKAGYLVSY